VSSEAGLASDRTTSLVWARAAASSARKWQEAQSDCAQLNAKAYGGYSSGWRLPTAAELLTLTDDGVPTSSADDLVASYYVQPLLPGRPVVGTHSKDELDLQDDASKHARFLYSTSAAVAWSGARTVADQHAFPKTGGKFWSSESYLRDRASWESCGLDEQICDAFGIGDPKAWAVSFFDGAVASVGAGSKLSVLCVHPGRGAEASKQDALDTLVRSLASPPQGERFSLVEDGTSVRDAFTGLTWEHAQEPEHFTPGQGALQTEAVAAEQCSKLRLGGHDDWRLPTRRELLTLVDRSAPSLALPAVFSTPEPGSRFWSSTPYANDRSYFWVVSFDDGTTDVSRWDRSTVFRCVR
jgi:hypothetical protein